jgi:hypothetical protein
MFPNYIPSFQPEKTGQISVQNVRGLKLEVRAWHFLGQQHRNQIYRLLLKFLCYETQVRLGIAVKLL